MTNDNDDATHHFSSEPILFAHGSTALLGLDANGATPQRIYGLQVEAEIAHYKGDVLQSFWLKAITEKPQAQATKGEYAMGLETKRTHPAKSEYVLFADSASEMEKVFGAIIGASVIPGFVKDLDKPLGGYANTAQTDFSDETTEECVEDCFCTIQNTEAGFSLRLKVQKSAMTPGHGPTVTTVFAKMSPKSIDDTIRAVEKMRGWAKEHTREAELAVSNAPTP